MIRLVRGLMIACALTTFALVGWEAEAHWFGNLTCSTPYTGTCPGGTTCTDYETGWSCSLSGAGKWSVCINAYFSSCGYSTGCAGTLTNFMVTGCTCYGDQFGTGGC